MPWSSDAPMSRVDKFELPADQFPEPSDDALEHVFRIHNAVDGTERNVRLGIRSLSVGDASNSTSVPSLWTPSAGQR